MHNFASTSQGRSRVGALELYRLWDVDEEPAYQIQRTWESWSGPNFQMSTEGRSALCIVRTLSGKGVVKTHAGQTWELEPNTLLIVPWESLASWGTTADVWRFYWFECFVEPDVPLTVDYPMQVPHTPAEAAETISIQRQLRSRSELTRKTATARFTAMLYQWLEQADTTQPSPKHWTGVEVAIDLMHDNIHKQLSVPDMAAQAGLSPRAFASAFERATGTTPKRYHLDLRLDAVRALLLSGRANVKEAAHRLGFSSPFYLSKLYRQRYGHPPSQAH